MKIVSLYILFFLSIFLATPYGSWASEVVVEAPAANIKNYRIKGGLASNKALGCIGLNEINNTMIPPDLFRGLKKCINQEKYDNAANLYFAARLFGAYDAKRVADRSAGQGITVLQINTFNSIDKKKTEKLQALLKEQYGKGSKKLAALCTAFKSVGYPTYYPKYMILHGIGAFTGVQSNGLKREFDQASEWNRLLSRNCGVKTGPEAAWPKTRYELYKGTVRYRSPRGERLVKKADPTSFEALSEAFGRDKIHVFFGDKIVKGADPNSFEVIDFLTGRDKTAIYRTTQRCDECDVESFRKVGKKQYVDKNAVYRGLGDDWKRSLDVDSETLVELNSWFSKDKNNVFYSGRVIPGADSVSFKLGSCGKCIVCGEDKNHCYWNEHPVPCDCKGRSRANYPRGLADVPVGKSLIKAARPVNIDFKNSSLGYGNLSYGYFVGEPGKKLLKLRCFDRDSRKNIYSELEVDTKPGQIYSIGVSEKRGCTNIKVIRPALVVGKADGLQLFMRNKKFLIYSREYEPGKHTLSVICREVSKNEMQEIATKVTLDMNPGNIYKLKGKLSSSKDRCAVTATPVRMK